MSETSPFDFESDPEGDKNALTKALQIVKGFALYFVVSEVSRVRPRLMDEIEARFPDKKIQRIHLTGETTNLLHLFQEKLDEPLPDIVFVSGFENVISASAEPRSHPLLLNINATRNNFYALLPRPVVLWVPPFVLKAILQAAPDFISVRSGVYTFALLPKEREQMRDIASSISQREILGFGQAERDNRITEMQSLLSEYRSLAANERNPQDEALILNQLGVAYTSLGQYTQAEPLYNEALSIHRISLPAGHPEIATSLNNLAALYESEGRYSEAEPLFDEALSINRNALPAGHSEIATSLNNLAALYKSEGRYAEAKPLYDEALSINRNNLPAGHPDIATSLNNLALLYESEGRYAEAEPLLNEALSINRNTLPTGHPDIAANLNNLALLYKAEGRYAEAESLLDEALSTIRNTLPAGHPDTAASLSNLAGLYRAQNRYAEAEPLFDEALSIHRASLPAGHPDIATSLNNLAALYGSQGRYDEAKPLYDEAIKILQSVFTEDHPLLQMVKSNFTNLLNDKIRQPALRISASVHKVSRSSTIFTFAERQNGNVVIGKATHQKKKSQRKEPKFKPFR